MKTVRNRVELAYNVLIDATTGKECAVESNGALAVNIQDQHSLALDLRFIQQTNATTLSANADPEDTSITITSTTGFVDGVTVGIFSATGIFYFGMQVGAPVGNVISLDTPIDRAFLSGDNVISANHHLNVNGAVTTQVFQVGPVGAGTGIEIDITRLMGYIESDGTPSAGDALFGNLTSLTNGVVLRINNDTISNIWNVKNNGEFGLLCYDTAYSPKPPAGAEGFRFRNTYAGQAKHGVTLRLVPGDTLEILIQDDLTELNDFQMMAQGHVVTD